MQVRDTLKKMNFNDREGTVLNAPSYLQHAFQRAGLGSQLRQGCSFTILFLHDKNDFDMNFKSVLGMIGYDSNFWLAYKKGTSKFKTDINRDRLWSLAKPFGYRPVSVISIDKNWSAMRFRPVKAVK